jgi:hypothetical protein
LTKRLLASGIGFAKEVIPFPAKKRPAGAGELMGFTAEGQLIGIDVEEPFEAPGAGLLEGNFGAGILVLAHKANSGGAIPVNDFDPGKGAGDLFGLIGAAIEEEIGVLDADGVVVGEIGLEKGGLVVDAHEEGERRLELRTFLMRLIALDHLIV